MERIALVLTAGSSTSSGRRPGDVVDATQLDLVGFAPGSTILEVEPPETHARLFEVEPDLVERSLGTFLSGINALADDPDHLPDGFDRRVVNGLANLTGSVGNRISSIEFSLGDAPPVIVDQGTKTAVQRAQKKLEREEVEITGRLHMGDFAPATLRCRIDTAEGSVTCDFDDELRAEVLAAMDKIVAARGVAEYWPDEARPRLLHLGNLAVIEEAEEESLDQVLHRQGITPVASIDDLTGPAVDDFDEFLAAVRSVRSR
ncbi:MAG: hypothetical protein ACRDUY_16695 [Nitriliruptorales bacterium]